MNVFDRPIQLPLQNCQGLQCPDARKSVIASERPSQMQHLNEFGNYHIAEEACAEFITRSQLFDD
jgi:hypothetical protein